MKINAVIFDYDGVIADSGDMIFDITSRFMERHGVRLEKGAMLTGNAKEALRKAGLEHRMAEFMPFLKSESVKRFREVKVFAGMKTVITQLHGSHALGIVSNGFMPFIERHLSLHGLSGYIRTVVDGTEPRIKPDPYQILKCLSLLGATPEECCYVGDTETDIVAARAAGVAKVIAVSYGFHNAEMLKNADAIIHNPESIITAMNE